MYLTEIAAAIVSAINSSSPDNWGGGLVLPTDLPVLVDGLDPLTLTANTEAGIFVIPNYNEYDLTKMRDVGNNTRRAPLTRTRFLTVATCIPFDMKFDKNQLKDATLKADWSLISKLQEDLEQFLINTSISGHKLVSIETQAPDEIALDSRLFLVPIIVGYKC